MAENNYQFDTALRKAKERIEGNYVSYNISHGFAQIYPFTTENIAGYINHFNLKDKSLLTVGSSLDQTFSGILYDASKITVMDINPYTKYYYYLKLACVLELSYYEYQEFLRFQRYPSVFKENQKVFNKQLFNKIKDTLRVLDYESYLFWDELIQAYPPIDVRTSLFSGDEEQTRVLKSMIPYLKDEGYFKQLKNKALHTEVTFNLGDVFDINIPDKYDNIWLSNIGTYLNSREELKQLLLKYKDCLTDRGMLLLSYLYQTAFTEEYQSEWAPIYDFENLFKELEEYQLETMSFIGTHGILHETDTIKDSALIYRKK